MPLYYKYPYFVSGAHANADGSTEQTYLINLLKNKDNSNYLDDTLHLIDGALIVVDFQEGLTIYC